MGKFMRFLEFQTQAEMAQSSIEIRRHSGKCCLMECCETLQEQISLFQYLYDQDPFGSQLIALCRTFPHGVF